MIILFFFQIFIFRIDYLLDCAQWMNYLFLVWFSFYFIFLFGLLHSSVSFTYLILNECHIFCLVRLIFAIEITKKKTRSRRKTKLKCMKFELTIFRLYISKRFDWALVKLNENIIICSSFFLSFCFLQRRFSNSNWVVWQG